MPNEQEWEWAAGGGKRKYPWGDHKPDKTRANFGLEVGHTAPAGSYPEGATPDGLMDMAGNAWEWMENPDPKYPDVCSLRGGSWSFGADLLPCSVRTRVSPEFYWGDDGFRVACLQSFDLKNPFIVGPPVASRNMFFGRTEIIRKIINGIYHNHYYLYPMEL